MWLFKPKIEDRQSGGIPFSDAVVEAIVQAAGGTTPADPTAIAAVEAAAGLYARCFASASVTGDLAETITPAARALIARDLIRRGESVHLIEVTRGQVSLIPVGSWGCAGPLERTRLVVSPRPVRTVGECHPFCARPHGGACPLCGRPGQALAGHQPLQWARHTGTLAANLEQRLGEEAGGTVAHVLPNPPGWRRRHHR